MVKVLYFLFFCYSRAGDKLGGLPFLSIIDGTLQIVSQMETLFDSFGKGGTFFGNSTGEIIGLCQIKVTVSTYRIASYNFRRNYSFSNLEIQRQQYIRPNVTVHKVVETIQGRKLFEGGNYMRKYKLYKLLFQQAYLYFVIRHKSPNRHYIKCHIYQDNIKHGRNWLSKSGWASSDAECHWYPAAPSNLQKGGVQSLHGHNFKILTTTHLYVDIFIVECAKKYLFLTTYHLNLSTHLVIEWPKNGWAIYTPVKNLVQIGLKPPKGVKKGPTGI